MKRQRDCIKVFLNFSTKNWSLLFTGPIDFVFWTVTHKEHKWGMFLNKRNETIFDSNEKDRRLLFRLKLLYHETTPSCITKLLPPLSQNYSLLYHETTPSCITKLLPPVSRNYSLLYHDTTPSCVTKLLPPV